MPVFASVAIIAYILSLVLIIPSLLRKSGTYRHLALFASCIAILAHAATLYQRIFDISSGQNLSLLNVASCVSLLINLIMLIVASRHRGWFLLPIVYSFAIINILLSSIMPGEFITHLESTPSLLFHIGLALLAYATLVIAALYALQLGWLDYLLKNKKFTFTTDMPPLMVLERKVFHITQVGIVFLTLTLCTGLLYMDNLFDQENIHKTIFSIIAWFIYIIMLWGHYREGWRGRRIIWFSFVGIICLTIAYFASRVLQ